MVPDGNNNLGKDSSAAGRYLTRKGGNAVWRPVCGSLALGGQPTVVGISGRESPG